MYSHHIISRMNEKPTGQQAKNYVENRDSTTSNGESGILHISKSLRAHHLRARSCSTSDLSAPPPTWRWNDGYERSNGRLCRVGLRVNHGLRYTYIAGVVPASQPTCEPGENSECTRIDCMSCSVKQDIRYLDAETRGLS